MAAVATQKAKDGPGHGLAAALESQRVKYDALVESIGEGLIVIDQNGKIERVNGYASEALGYSEQELLGKWFPAALPIFDEAGHMLSPINRPMAQAMTEGKAVTRHASLLCKNGKKLPCLITASPLLIDDRPAGAIEVFRDLTREHELEIAKDEFVSIASHQLRTPATGIRGILSMILNGDFGELTQTQARYIEMAARSNERQLHIIEDLLNVARADSGRLELNRSETCLTSAIEEVVTEHRLPLESNQQTLNADLAPDIRAYIDTEKIQMVIDNLINNASKYTPVGGTIWVKLAAKDGYAYISVRDNGVGIPEDKLGAIFTKFMRVENDLSVPAGGTGLGLYLAQKVVNLHSGAISVTSKLGEGSDFRIQLPITRGKESDHGK